MLLPPLGIIAVPLDKALPDNEIESSIIRSEVQAVIFDKKYLDMFNNLKDKNNTNLEYFICMDFENDENDILSFSNLIKKGNELLISGSNLYDSVSIDNNSMSVMLFTSGTTSISKIVMLSQANICADIYSIGCIARVTSKDTFLSFLPLHHTYESTTTFLYGLYCGITIAFCDGLRYIVQNLKEYKVTGFVAVPLILETMYKKVIKGIEEKGMATKVKFASKICNLLLKFGIDIRRKVFKSILNEFGGKLRIIIYGAAPMSKEAISGLSNFGLNLLNGYGLTETSPVVSAENDKYKRPGSVAFPLPNIDVNIDSPNDTGIGEIIVKGPNVMLGYYDNQSATDEVLKNGWFYTGDLGFFDKDGYLFVTGRKKNVIVLKNGKNIYPEELEILIAKLPYVAENFVFGRPTKDDDLEINAKVVYNPDLMKEIYPDKDVNEYHSIVWKDIKNINSNMPAYKHIRNIIVTDEPMIKTTTRED